MENSLGRFLWKGLDLIRYEPVEIIPQHKNVKNAVIIMRCRDDHDHHWCVEYKGNGCYFTTFEEMAEYYYSRFSVPLTCTASDGPGGAEISVAYTPGERRGVTYAKKRFQTT